MTDPEIEPKPNTIAQDMLLIAESIAKRAEVALQDALLKADLGLPSNIDYALRFSAAADSLLRLCSINLLSDTGPEP